MKYIVAYKTMSEIAETYCVDAPSDDSVIHECIILQGVTCCAQFIKSDMPHLLPEQKPLLQRTTRCYIINTDDIPRELAISEILDRYG